MRGGYHGAMAAKMSVQPAGAIRNLCETSMAAHEVNKNRINDGFEWYLNSMSKGPRSKPKNKELLQHLISFCSAMTCNYSSKIIDEDSSADMNHFVVGCSETS